MENHVQQTVQQSPPGSSIPFKPAAAGSGAVASGGAAVLVVSMLAIAIALYLRRRLNLGRIVPQGQHRLRVLETQMLGPRTLLAVVEFGGREHLIAQTEHGVTRIADIEAEPK
jgi:flagellar protein FliO/FliZ